MKKLRETGITLIALIVTIIVLLILAGVTIVTLTGENGILTKAANSKERNNYATAEEEIKLKVMETQADKLGKATLKDIVEKLQQDTQYEYIVNLNSKSASLSSEGEIKVVADDLENKEEIYVIHKGYEFKIDMNMQVSKTGNIIGEGEQKGEDEKTDIKVKIGDYVNYVPEAPNNTQLQELNTEVNEYSGYDSIQELSQDTTIKWRVLELDDNGNITKLISDKVTGSLSFKGANGYNNCVYLLNKACKILYSSDKGEARSLSLQDLESKMNQSGLDIRNSYNSLVAKYGETVKYNGTGAYYPLISADENKIGINTTTLKTDGLNTNEQNKIYNGHEIAKSNGITVTQTSYEMNQTQTQNIYNEQIYNELFLNNSDANTCGLLASRGIYTSYDNCIYTIYTTNYGNISNYWLYFSNNSTENNLENWPFRPIVSLKSGVSAEYDGKKNEEFNIWNLK